MAKKGQEIRSFSPEYKRRAVRMYLEEHRGLKSIAKELGLPSHTYVKRWVKAFQEKGEEGLKDHRGKSSNKKRRSPQAKSMEEENLQLRAENEYLKKLLQQEGWDVPNR
ncbi:Transposase and inactivated derivatives [Marininema mesophilum]|uniref:Transposase and inactivated derivatives n=1 Tax=Marininema mesophilum TaxID=1048340 RepID=A0A1H2UN19_9BACL|nr:transposase [Marininema mesophilum]SDW57511.1 Transposase and inactivated derivatives [Marininema mesophilum]